MRTLILTAIPTEYRSVRSSLVDLEEIETADGTIFERGNFNFQDKTLEIFIGQCGMGNIKSAIYTERAIKTINPSLVIFCGIAGGIKDVDIGDVVVASKVYSYEGGKDKGGLNSRPDGHACTYSIVQRALIESTTNKWQSEKSKLEYKVVIGPICVGEKVLADKKSKLFKYIKTHYNDSLAVEMESMGFIGAAHSNNCENFAVVRGISDLIDNKEGADNDGFQETAALHAAEFTFILLRKIWKNIKPRIPKEIGLKLSFGEMLNSDQIESVLAGIRNLTKDMNIKLETVTYGSTNFYLKMSEETSEKLKLLIDSGAFKKEIGLESKSLKRYLFTEKDLPISMEFNRFLPNNESEFKQLYNFISVNIEKSIGEYLNDREPNLKMDCIIFASYQSDFEFLSANRISIIDTKYNIEKGNQHIRGLDFVRNEAIHSTNNIIWSSLTSFKNDIQNNNIAIFKFSLNDMYESLKALSNIIDLEDESTHNSITKLDKKFQGAESYVIIRLGTHLSDFKKANRLIVDRVGKVSLDENIDDEM